MFKLFRVDYQTRYCTYSYYFEFVCRETGEKHWNAAKACLRYLKGTKSEKLIYRKYDKLHLKGFSDSD